MEVLHSAALPDTEEDEQAVREGYCIVGVPDEEARGVLVQRYDGWSELCGRLRAVLG